MKTLVICSGGLDSVSLAHITATEHQLTRLVSFDYGQRHRKEVDFAEAAAKRLGVPFHLIDMRGIGAALSGSALTDDIDVPDGHYAEETMKITVCRTAMRSCCRSALASRRRRAMRPWRLPCMAATTSSIRLPPRFHPRL